MDLTVLNEQQLQEFVRIVAEDFKIKYETLQRLRATEAESIVLTKQLIKDSHCQICLQLINQLIDSRQIDQSHPLSLDKCIDHKGSCKFCTIRNYVERKHKEWLILCPFKVEQFGHAKYLCKCPCINDNDGWYLRATLELHIIYKLGVQIDTVYVLNFSTCGGVLEKCGQKLFQALSTYNSMKPFQYIDDIISDIELIANKNYMVECALKRHQNDYFLLLTNAVISVMASKKTAIIKMATNEINSLEFKSRSEKIVGKNRISESFDQSNRQSSNTNTLSKEIKLLKNIFPKDEFDRKRFQRIDSLFSTAGSKSFLRSGEMSSKGLTVKMLKKEMNVRTGDMVILLGAIISDDLDLNVSWYIDKKEVISGGRFRHWRKGFDCCMEIFDCNITDAGDIMCIVRAENYIASDNTILHVNDDDMAGIEPQFLQLLEFEEINDCLRLACQVSGYPTPYVTFHFRNRRIVSNQRITIDRNNDFWMVRINRCTVDDEGKYIAIARNRIGRTLSSCSVILRNKNPSTYIADV